MVDPMDHVVYLDDLLAKKDLEDLISVEAKSFADLDWFGTILSNDVSSFGWLDRKGNFYGCDYYAHDMQAKYVHGKSRQELEKLGWIHIGRSSNKKDAQPMAYFSAVYYNKLMPTKAQLAYLNKRDDIDVSQILEVCKSQIEVQQENTQEL